MGQNPTDRPWKAAVVGNSEPSGTGVDVCEILTHDECKRVAEYVEIDDAELIVRAVNSHAALVAACEAAEIVMEGIEAEYKHGAWTANMTQAEKDALAKCRTALAQARGE